MNTANWGAAEWRLVLDVLNAGALLALWVYAVMTRRSKDNEGRLGAIDRDIKRIDLDLVGLRTKLDAVPDHDDLEKLHARISDVRKQVDVIGREVSSTAATVAAIDRNVALLNRTLVGGNGSD